MRSQNLPAAAHAFARTILRVKKIFRGKECDGQRPPLRGILILAMLTEL